MSSGRPFRGLQIPSLTAAACLCLLSGSCNQNPDTRPVVQQVLPRALGAGERRYLLIDGSGFEPAFSWSAQSGKATVSSDIAVAIDDGPFFTEGVHLLHPGRLSVLPPAVSKLDPGWHALTVRLANGNQHRLEKAFYVDGSGYDALVIPCLSDSNNDGRYDHRDLGLCELEQQPDGTYQTRLLVANVVTSFDDGGFTWWLGGWQRGFTFSPLGNWLAMMRFVAGPPPGVQLVLRHLPSAREQVLDQLTLPSPPADDPTYYDLFNLLWEVRLKNTFGTPAFSPDESLLTYVRQGNQVMLVVLGQGPEQVLPPQLLAQPAPGAGSNNLLYYPSIDAGNRFVLVTEADFQANEDGDLVVVAIKPLLIGIGNGSLQRPTSADPHMDGSATFLPSGAEMLFYSDRLDLAIMTPMGFVAPATGLYRMGLFGGPVNKVPARSAAFLFGRLEVAPDGVLAAASGFLTTSNSGIDVVVTDLEDGKQQVAGLDAVGSCFPGDTESDCTEMGYQENWSLPCCQLADSETYACCSKDTPWLCPTWDLLPAFSGFSGMASFAMAIDWQCKRNESGPGTARYVFTPTLAQMLFSIYATDGNQLDGTTLLTDQNWLPFVPAYQRRVKPPPGPNE